MAHLAPSSELFKFYLNLTAIPSHLLIVLRPSLPRILDLPYLVAEPKGASASPPLSHPTYKYA